jgi:2'-phosphotransferase
MSNVQLSKSMSWALRHGAQELGLSLREDGYVEMKELCEKLGRKMKRRLTPADLMNVAKLCPKKVIT